MSTHTPTPEQAAIIEAAATTTDNLIVNALAGAAKTSTIIMMSEAVRIPSLALAFNKRIALELQERMPAHVTCKTLNALGHAAVGQMLGKRLNVKADKRRWLLREYINNVADEKEKTDLFDAFQDLTRAISHGVACGYVPDSYPRGPGKRLCDDDEFFSTRLDFEPTRAEIDAIRTVSHEGIAEALRGNIDFDDQIFISTLWPASFPAFPLVYVDEAQDLSLLQHKMLEKVARKRLIAVGDPCQAIYGFRGAHEDSMARLASSRNMRELFLSVSFRLPTSVADHVRWRAPHIASPEWAKTGTVTTLSEWSGDDLPEAAAIICRNNAPLFSCALRLLAEGKRPELIGNDLVTGLVKDMKRLSKDMTLEQDDTLVLIDAWLAKAKRKSRNPGAVEDKAECMRLFVRASDTLGIAIARVEQISNMKGSIKLMTGHRSKGLEFPHVYFLDEHLINPERDPQANNLRYVIATRAQETLTYIKSDDYVR